VGRSLDLLEALAEPGELGLAQVASRTGLQPSTAHRLLATLVERGYVTQNAETGRYLLGYRLLELATGVQARTERLRALTRPHLLAVQKITGETASLTILEPPSLVYVDQVEGSRSVRMFARLGAAVPPHTTASGKAILAFTKSPPLAEICGPEPFDALTPRTITTLTTLEQELARVRRRRYAVDNEEHEVGVSCVAAPIFDHDGAVRAAIGVSGPTPRIRGADTAELGELVSNRAAEISRALGLDPASVSAGAARP
jgi:IclR family acetate operon transcriptional repressor